MKHYRIVVTWPDGAVNHGECWAGDLFAAQCIGLALLGDSCGSVKASEVR